MEKLTKQVLTELNNAWLMEYVKEEPTYNPLDILKTDDDGQFEKKLIWLLMQPDYFGFICKEIFNVELLPFQIMILQELWVRKFPMFIASRGGSKTFLLALYCLMRALMMPGRKIVVAGAGFRQSRFVHDYMETIWNNAPILRDLCTNDSGGSKAPDVCRFIINDSIINSLPIGDGSKIRGYRANDLVADEFQSHNKEIFETVLAGFANVSANPVQEVKRRAASKSAKNKNIDYDPQERGLKNISNQIIVSGTAYYDFNHFFSYWKRYKAILDSKGDPKILRGLFGEDIPKAFDWKNYSIIRLPYDLLPEGFLDDGNIARSKVTVHSGVFDMEYNCVFSSDSKGFFKRSLIEKCVASESNDLILPSGKVVFDSMLKGDPKKKYVIGVDPASEVDNFCIVVIELNGDHRRIVHCWTIIRSAHTERVKLGLTTEDNFYSYCARKIRDLMAVFPTERIMIDAGGGIAVSEALHETSNLKEGESLIWPVIEEKEKPSDDEIGLHIIEMVQFSSAAWVGEANHSLRKDMEDRVLLFPKFDPIVLGLAAEQDRVNNKLYDTLEDCVMEIEEMKNELVLIEVTQTPGGRERWDTPDVKTGTNKKQRLRKDRYSALLMANMGARNIKLTEDAKFESFGGFSRTVTTKGKMEHKAHSGLLRVGKEYMTAIRAEQVTSGTSPHAYILFYRKPPIELFGRIYS